MFKEISRLFELKIKQLELKIKKLADDLDRNSIVDRWSLETGRKFNMIINNYPISEEELLLISETVAKFVGITRITNIDKYLFVDDELITQDFYTNYKIVVKKGVI